MLKIQVIGNLGADAELHQSNGSEFISFRVAHTESITRNGVQTDSVTWVDVTMNGNGGQLLQYLKKGAKVFVDGNLALRVYSSKKDRCMKAGATCFARTVELCGGSSDVVPRELITQDGILLRVNKYFHIEEPQFFNQIVFDKNMNQYATNENGWVLPVATTTNSNETAAEDDTNGNGTTADNNNNGTGTAANNNSQAGVGNDAGSSTVGTVSADTQNGKRSRARSGKPAQ